MESPTITNRLKSRIKRPKVFFTGIVLVSLSILMLVATLFAPNLSQFTSGDIQRMENTISTKSSFLINISNQWLNNTSHTEATANAILNQKVLSKLKESGLAVYLYDSTKLKAWSQIPNFTKLDKDSLTSTIRLNKFSDSWTLAAKVEKNSKAVVYSIEIQKNYKINNKFLEDNFNPMLGIPPHFQLSTKYATGESRKHQLIICHGNKPLFALKKISTNYYDKPLKDTFYYLALLLFMLGGWSILLSIDFKRRLKLLFISISLFSIADIVLVKILAAYSPSLVFFSPELYSSSFTSSLASMSIYVLTYSIVCSAIYYHFTTSKFEKNRQSTLMAWGLSTLLAASVAICNIGIYSLINDSTISFGIIKISELSRHSIFTFGLITLLIINSILLANLFVRIFRSIETKRKVVILLIPLIILSIITSSVLQDAVMIIFFTIAVITYAIFLFFIKPYGRISIGSISLIIVIWTIGASLAICNYLITKDYKTRITFAESLYNENDPIVEYSLPDLSHRFITDSTIRALIVNPAKNDDSLYRYIRSNYMNGYLNRYNLIVTICPENANLYLSNEKKTTNCESYFSSLFKQFGDKIPASSFYYIRNFPGQVSYMGQIDYNINGKRHSLYIEFDVKTINNNPGYPELLIKKTLARNNKYDEYDYAHYVNGVLVAKNGSCSYPSIITPPTERQKYKEIKANGYVHLYYRFDKSNTLVISRTKLRLFDMASSFSYIFILLAFLGLLIFKKSNFPLDDSLSFKTFKGRITLSFIFVLTAALILTALASLLLGIARFDSMKQKTIMDKMKSAIPAVQSALSNPNPNVLPNELVKVSNYLYVDVNLYTPEGDLYATSRPEIFYEGLQGFKMSPIAYKKLAIEHEGFFVDKEHIGTMSFTSSYSPIFAGTGKLQGYVNLPYFLQYNDLRKELYTIAIATANIFILLLLPVILIAVIISKSITRPLALIRNRMHTFDLKTNPDPIPYHKNDEIGDLISEFNKMVYQVELSADLLAKSERDMAWREMARQIAHEIKNPLTPMKLSLQYLMMMKNKKDERWLDQFDRYAASQIEQIDSLAKIATEFSDFAKINFDDKTPIFDVRELVDEILPIFDGFPNLKIEAVMADQPSTIQIDREHMKRVIVNLLKNATQAFEKNEHPLIKVTVKRDDEFVVLSVEDTGKGIDDDAKRKIFTPNFTTKSSGSGLGLAISKNLIEAYNGRIWFQSEFGVGTIFFVELPFVAPRKG